MNRVLVTFCLIVVVLTAGCAESLGEFGQGDFPEPPGDIRDRFDGEIIDSFDARLGGVTDDGDVVFYRADSFERVEVSLIDITLVGFGPQEGVPQTLDVMCLSNVTESVEAELTPSGQSVTGLYTVVVVPTAGNGTSVSGDAFPATAEGDVPTLSEVLVRQGLAVYTPVGEYDSESTLAVAEDVAIEEQAGIWGCEEIPPLK